VLRSVIDRDAVARALARARRPREPGGPRVTPNLPAFGPDGTRVGDPRTLHLDWSHLPREYLRGPGAVAALNRALDTLSPRDRAVLLVDIEGLALRDVARGLDEPLVRVRRRLHRARMIVREELTAYFAAATTPH
jgi:DNA-directed RNA polymerase specialized sigma24 family protein